MNIDSLTRELEFALSEVPMLDIHSVGNCHASNTQRTTADYHNDKA